MPGTRLWPDSVRVLAISVVSLLAVATLSSCAAKSQNCAGQCGPPYELDVSFRTATTISEARAALAHCSHEPGVVRVGSVKHFGSGLEAFVYTTDIGRTAKTAAVLDCLKLQPQISEAVYPG